jgi:aspartyl-tRNA(Asn)/glutamyl-tRNA(Gln) amidotransferase subunit A
MTGTDPLAWDAAASTIAQAVAAGAVSAVEVARAALARIEAVDPMLTAFTDRTVERAMAEARAVDALRAGGHDLGPLAGVPFAVKNLFAIEGLTTRAGSALNRGHPPASADAFLVRKLNAAGAVLTGALNMGEYAYDFTGENAHDGVCRNPVDPAHMAGGSSSGSGAATAAGLAPISLGSDTNGSIRVPASFCGIFGLKPTYGRLGRSGTFPFCDSLDHLGPLARSVGDLAIAYDALQGHDPADRACASRPAEPVTPSLDAGIGGLRIVIAGGWFERQLTAAARTAVARVGEALGATAVVVLDDAAVARAAAFLITNAESAALHLDRLRTAADGFDPDTRDRFLAGALLPAGWLVKAQMARHAWAERLARLFRDVDLLIAPATPSPAPSIGQRTMTLDGIEMPTRPNIGLFTQPISCAGLPVACVPAAAPGELPIGVQLVAAPWREDLCLRAARHLEAVGVSQPATPHPSLGL